MCLIRIKIGVILKLLFIAYNNITMQISRKVIFMILPYAEDKRKLCKVVRDKLKREDKRNGTPQTFSHAWRFY